MNVTPHFTLEEFKCKSGDPYPLPFLDRLQKLCTALELIRAKLNAPITITSGYRTVAYNVSIGGATKSQHCDGRAADIVVPNWHPHDVHDLILKMYQDGEIDIGGLGRYDGWCHVDTRLNIGHLCRWEGRET